MKKFVAEPSFWELFPEAEIGIVVLSDLKSTDLIPQEDKDALEHDLKVANIEADKFIVNSTLSKNPVVAVWRDAYQKFKTKKGARVSIEALLKRVMKGNPVGTITPLVDTYNIISLRHGFPVGGEDIDAFDGDVRLTVTQGGDDFVALGDEEPSPTLEGELCYKDDAGAICRCWNWRDGVRTALTDESRNAFLIIENVDPARRDELETALDELADLATSRLGASVVAKNVVTREHPEMVIAE